MTSTVGRKRELARAREQLSFEIPGGVMFLGPAGIGKSTVLAATAEAAATLGFDVRQSRATVSERDLPYVGLHDLIGGALHDLAPSLPDPLRRALDVVLLRVDPPAGGVDALAVNLAALEVLQAMADRQRLLLVLDDLQWLDQPTRQVLEFALRRLPRSRVGVIAASRDVRSTILSLMPEPVEIIEVAALSEDEVADLVALRTGLVLSPQRVAAVYRLSAGNPFLALELARGHPSDLSGVEKFPVPERYLRVLAPRLSALSPDARRAVLAAALLSRPTAPVLAMIGGPEGLTEAEAAGVLHVKGNAAEFDHPLLAAACRHDAGPVVQRAMHLVLASLTEDPVERARHTALGTPGVDAVLADEVEAAAGLAAERTAMAAAADLARDALRLTPADALADRVRRAVAAARWFSQIAEREDARAVMDPVLAALPDGPLRARCLIGLADAMGQEVAGSLLLLRDALGQPGIEAEVAVEARLGLADCLTVRGDLEEGRREAAGAAAAATAAGMTQHATTAWLMEARVALFLGLPPERSEAWTGAPALLDGPVYIHPDTTLAWAASWRDDQAEASRLLEGLIRRARERGDLASEGSLALHCAEVALRDGRLTEAAARAERSYRARADGVHDQALLYVRAHVAAWRGELEGARHLAGVGLEMAVAAGDAFFEAQCRLVLGFTEVSAARFDEAARHESRLRDLLARMRWGHPGAYRWHGDAVEAFLAVGRMEDAAEVTARLWEEGDRLDLSGCRALAARCEGLVHAQGGDLKRAEDSLELSLALMSGLDMPLNARARSWPWVPRVDAAGRRPRPGPRWLRPAMSSAELGRQRGCSGSTMSCSGRRALTPGRSSLSGSALSRSSLRQAAPTVRSGLGCT